MGNEPSRSLIERTARILGWTLQSWRPVKGGYTPAARYLVSAGDDSVFVKVATTPLTAKMLRQESLAYQRVRGGFIPRLVAWSDDEFEPLLIIEDLSTARWPPPWERGAVDSVLEQIAAMHACKADLPAFMDAHVAHAGGWSAVAENPAPFLGLRLTTNDWLVRALPKLVEAERACHLEGAAITHFDLRSDNICVAKTGVKFVDWAEACLGNPAVDLGFWLPSLCFEGGPRPEDLLPNRSDVAAWVSGFFAARAGLPNIPDAPFVRRVQREQLSTALPWAIRALHLDDLSRA